MNFKNKDLLLSPVRILKGANTKARLDSVLIKNGSIKAFGEEAISLGEKLNIKINPLPKHIFAPCLVDPHSFLENPINGIYEDIGSLRNKAIQGGYGQIALLPRATKWRDSPENLIRIKNTEDNVLIHLWGSFSKEGKGLELSNHADLLDFGAIGIAEDDSLISSNLLKQGLLLGEMGLHPVLLAPRDLRIQGEGIARESIETLRAGLTLDPISSETIPLSQILEFQRQHQNINIRIMNISTASGVDMLKRSTKSPLTSVSWWHLIKDNSLLPPNDMGWRVCPSLGSPEDRDALCKALADGRINSISVHGNALSEEELKLPLVERAAGISGHHLVLSSLWQELISKSHWELEKLWEVLSFGPSRFLNLPEEKLQEGSRRWILFDPEASWTPKTEDKRSLNCANEPFSGEKLIGKVIASGLRNATPPFD